MSRSTSQRSEPGVFYIVGPTAVGKSELAADVTRICGGEIVSADAFQIYTGLDLLTAKPHQQLLDAVPHHLIGVVPLTVEMNAEHFRHAALEAISAIQSRGKPAFVVGGSGMYVKALTHGLSQLPKGDPKIREELSQQTTDRLMAQLQELDPATAATIDSRNKHRLVRALEICLLSGKAVSEQRVRSAPAEQPAGVLLFRDRAELYERINKRVQLIFDGGVVDEVRRVDDTSSTAAKTLGLADIRDLIAGRIPETECVSRIQQATRRYAKRQLTWFQRQTNFEPLNLSLHGSSKAVEWIAQKARLSFAS